MSSGLRFRLGEVAVYMGPNLAYRGQEVEIAVVGPLRACESVTIEGVGGCHCTEPCDYVIRAQDGAHAFVDDACLRKRPQRGIPESVLRLFKAPIKRGQPA